MPAHCCRPAGALDGEFECRVMAQAVGIVAIHIAAGRLKNPLAEQIVQAVINVGRMPLIPDARRQTLDQSGLPIHPVHQECPEIAGDAAAFEVRADGKTCHGRKTELGRDTITHGQSRLSFLRSVIGVTSIISMS